MWIIFIYASIALLVITAGIVFYLLSISSRKTYRCPQCGERVTTEYHNAKRCGMCGAELRREI